MASSANVLVFRADRKNHKIGITKGALRKLKKTDIFLYEMLKLQIIGKKSECLPFLLTGKWLKTEKIMDAVDLLPSR